MVNHQWPGLAAISNQDGLVLQVGAPLQFGLGPQVGNEHSGDFQGAPLTGKAVRNWNTEISFVRKIKLSIEEGDL